MFDKNTINSIKNKILRDMKKYSVKPNEYKSFVKRKVDYEFDKYKQTEVDNAENIAIYDDEYNENNLNNFNVVYDDYVGKSDKLSVYNSYEDESLFKYITNSRSDNIHFIFEKVLFSLIYNYKMLFIFNEKNIFISLLSFLLNIISLLLHSCFLVIVGCFNIINYLLLKFLKFFVKLKHKKNRLLHNNIILICICEVLKFLTNLINGFFLLFNDLFVNNIDGFLNFITDTTNNTLYIKSFVYNGDVDRYSKSNEQKEFLNKVKENRIEYIKSLLKENIDYFKDLKFTKLVVKKANYENINNKVLKEYFKNIEKQQKKELIRDIISGRMIKKKERLTTKNDKFVNNIRAINNNLLKIANKDKELYRILVKKLGKNGLEI